MNVLAGTIDLAARAHADRAQGELERVGAVGDADAVRDLRERGVRGLEPADGRPADERRGREDLVEARAHLLGDLGLLGPQVHQRDRRHARAPSSTVSASSAVAGHCSMRCRRGPRRRAERSRGHPHPRLAVRLVHQERGAHAERRALPDAHVLAHGGVHAEVGGAADDDAAAEGHTRADRAEVLQDAVVRQRHVRHDDDVRADGHGGRQHDAGQHDRARRRSRTRPGRRRRGCTTVA